MCDGMARRPKIREGLRGWGAVEANVGQHRCQGNDKLRDSTVKTALIPVATTIACEIEYWRFPWEIMTALWIVEQSHQVDVKIIQVPFGRPLVPLENTRYARVSRWAGRTEMRGICSFRTCSFKSVKLVRPLARPPRTNILRLEIPASLEAAKAKGRYFACTKRHVALDNFRECFNSNGVE